MKVLGAGDRPSRGAFIGGNASRCPAPVSNLSMASDTQVVGTLTTPVQKKAIDGGARLTQTQIVSVKGVGDFGPLEQPLTVSSVISQKLSSGPFQGAKRLP